MSVKKQLHNSIKYPTSLLVNGADDLGVEIAKSLLEQGGYVIIIDSEQNLKQEVLEPLQNYKLVSLLTYDAIAGLADEIRRLDYVFYFEHKATGLTERISTQEFLQFSNYLDIVLDLTTKFEAKFMLTTSLKAHQAIVASKHLDLNYGTEDDKTHTIYTELELQRYAESLVQEYQENVGIDARILRVGVLLGRGMEVAHEHCLARLILDGLKKDNLHIHGDGLEGDYYIHYLDAAYGILKAQFSMNTKGRIFTLANEEEISELAIAYKILEILPEAKEIRFDNDNQMPPIKLYKPAPNLTTVGWSARITFERALAQSVDYIRAILEKRPKQSVADIEHDDAEPVKNIKEKLRDFFFVAVDEDEEEQEEVGTLDGALARLVTERKNQEQMRKGSIIMANSRIKEQVRTERLGGATALEKIDNYFTDLMFVFSKRLKFLKNVTVTDFFFYLLGFTAFAVIYFLLIAPLFSLGKNLLLINLNLKSLASAISVYDFEQSQQFNAKLYTNLEQAQTKLTKLEPVFNLLQQQNKHQDYQRLLASSIEYSSGYQDVFVALAPLGEYIHTLNPTTNYTYNSTNMLTVRSDQDFSDILDSLESNSISIELGVEKIAKVRTDLANEIQLLPPSVQQYIQEPFARIEAQFSYLEKTAVSYEELPSLLATTGEQNYLIVLQDNSVYGPAGGHLTGFIQFTLAEGNVKSMRIETAEELADSFEPDQLTEKVIQSINLLATRDVTRSNLQFNDLDLLADKSLYLQTLEELYTQHTGTKIDLTIAMNLDVLGRFLDQGKSLEYSQATFTNDNLLQNLDLLAGENGFAIRDQAIVNLYAKLLEDRLQNVSSFYPELVEVWQESSIQSDLVLYSDSLAYQNMIAAIYSQNTSYNDELRFGLNIDRNTESNYNKFPIITIVSKVNVSEDLKTVKEIEINAAGNDNLANVFTCVPSGAIDFDFSKITSDLVSSNFTTGSICMIFLQDADQKYQFKYSTTPLNSDVQNFLYSYRLQKPSGFDSSYTLEFTFAPELEVVPIDTSFFKQGNTYIYSGFLEKSEQIFSFQIK